MIVAEPWVMIAAVAVLAGGTFAFRYAGPALQGRISLPVRYEGLIATASIVLLAALVATQALVEGDGFAGWARPSGVLVAGVLAWYKTPFIVVVLAAAATTAGLRMLGVP